MTKFKKVFSQMLVDNKVKFDEFKIVQDQFILDKNKWRKKFNELGTEVQDIIRKYENELCGRSEGAGFANFTSKLAEKFWIEVRALFSEIDEIGVE